MNILAAGLLGALLAAIPPAGVSNLVTRSATPAPVRPAADPADPLEKEYQQLLAADDAAQTEVISWVIEARKEGVPASGGEASLHVRIRARLERVRSTYEHFLEAHPTHSRARLAFGSFLNDLDEPEAAFRQWQQAKDLDPKQPAVWNNLASYHSQKGDAEKAFRCYDKAIELDPRQSVYYQNLAKSILLFRPEAYEHYELDETQMFNRVRALYYKALAMDTNNFALATELAQTYYAFWPQASSDIEDTNRLEQKHHDDAIAAWQTALKLVGDDLEREGVYLHLARLDLMAGQFEEARQHLSAVTNEVYTGLKDQLRQNVLHRDKLTTAPPLGLRPGSSAGAMPPFQPAPGKTNFWK